MIAYWGIFGVLVSGEGDKWFNRSPVLGVASSFNKPAEWYRP